MTAELPGWIKALSAFVKTMYAATRARWSRVLALPAPDQFLGRRVPRQIGPRGKRGFTLTKMHD